MKNQGKRFNATPFCIATKRKRNWKLPTHCAVCDSLLKITIDIFDAKQSVFSKCKVVDADAEHLEKNTNDSVSERWCPNCGLLYKPE